MPTIELVGLRFFNMSALTDSGRSDHENIIEKTGSLGQERTDSQSNMACLYSYSTRNSGRFMSSSRPDSTSISEGPSSHVGSTLKSCNNTFWPHSVLA